MTGLVQQLILIMLDTQFQITQTYQMVHIIGGFEQKMELAYIHLGLMTAMVFKAQELILGLILLIRYAEAGALVLLTGLTQIKLLL